MVVHVGAKLIAGEPIDFVFLDAVVDDFIAERDAIGRAGVGALAGALLRAPFPARWHARPQAVESR